jgi:general L-amino acid transport system substrate-binding protein
MMVLFIFYASGAAQARTGATLTDIRDRGYLACGVNPGLAGFAWVDDSGKWQGFDVDFCRAVAAAVLGDANSVRFVPIATVNRFSVLQSGEVDLLAHNTTWTFTRDVEQGIDFAGPTYYDGQGIMVPASRVNEGIKQLKGKPVCVQSGTNGERNLRDFSEENDLAIIIKVEPNDVLATEKYLDGTCVALTDDQSYLAAIRSRLPNPSQHAFLNARLSDEPLSPAVRHGDAQWTAIVRWTFNILIAAEENGISSRNIKTVSPQETDLTKRYLAGLDPNFGEAAGLSPSWAFDVISQVGNYSEIYERNLGPKTSLGLPRRINANWRDGGMMYALPLQ